MFKKAESHKFNFEKVVINLALFSVLWLSFIYFGGLPASTNLDVSWSQALGYFFKHDFQVGVDYIFTYGLLGYFFQPFTAYDADLFYRLVAWWVIYGFLSAAVFLVIARNIQFVTEKFLYLTSLIFIISSFVVDARHFLFIIAITILIIEPPHFIRSPIRHFTATALAALILVILSLTKFTAFILSSFCVLSIAITFWHQNSYKVALTVLGSYVVLFLGVWILLDQSVLNIPSFLVNSVEVSRGYVDGMALAEKPLEIYLALAAVCLIVVLAGISNFKPWNLAQFLISMLVLFALFLVWKAGFVRYSTGHVLIFFCFAILAPFLLKRSHLGNLRTVIFRILLFSNFIICFMGIQFSGHDSSSNLLGAWNQRVVGNLKILSSLPEHKKALDNKVEQFRKEHALPKTRAAVGQATIDIFSWEQGIVFLNGLNWHPRPIFQSYIAYTPALISANGRFYASEQAPEFVLFKLQAIDGQFPWLNDSEALRILLRDYKPRFFEKGFLLLQRKPVNHDFAEPKSLLTRTVKFSENLVIENFKDKNIILSIEIEKSLLGKLISLLYKSPFIHMEIETTDGAQFSYRLIPGMAQSGFFINPLIQNQSELMKWYEGESLPQVATVRIVTSETGLAYFFKPTISVEVSEMAKESQKPLELQATPQDGSLTHRSPKWDNPLKSHIWYIAAPHYQQITLVPPSACGEAAAPDLPFLYLAERYGMTLNESRLAQFDAQQQYCDQLHQDIQQGKVKDKTIYILHPNYLEPFKKAAQSPVVCAKIDGFDTCVTERSFAVWRKQALLGN
ncbi:MAG: hypothetical protein DRR08_12255 [Candidatus Parabeggiatoa sp. nov. 2]|nr:MAG: hypothetical protein B6247_06680 [Beggiatoa sp. 4572_84]RKZ60062.1 MAG: hypothetical protein DRR08_12255 [Gammaproteobacteria bacterium]